MDDFKEKSVNLSRYGEDLLEIARLVSWCTDKDYLFQTCLEHLSRRLGQRARCVLLEGDELKMHCWVGKYDCPIDRVPVCWESIVWKVVENGRPINIRDAREAEGYKHTLLEEVKIKAIIPLWYIDPLTQEEKKVGALIVDCGKGGGPVSDEDFEYLKVVGELIGAAAGKAYLVNQLIEFYRRREAILKETAHNFRNRIAALGGLATRLARQSQGTSFPKEVRAIFEEVQALEAHLERFEKYMGVE
jgi:GAF domain-containing protein